MLAVTLGTSLPDLTWVVTASPWLWVAMQMSSGRDLQGSGGMLMCRDP